MIPKRIVINHLTNQSADALQTILTDAIGDVCEATVVAVLQQGKPVYHAAFGTLAPVISHQAVTPDTLFDLASVTKLFTATAFLSLVSAGKIGLDDPLVAVIPEFGELTPRPVDGGKDPHTNTFLPTPPEKQHLQVGPKHVTFRHLLTHSSGLAPWRDVYLAAGKVPVPPDAADPIPREVRWSTGLDFICASNFVDAVGQSLLYSDLGLMLLGESVARLHGASLDIAIRERVTDPLELASVQFNPVAVGTAREQIAPTEADSKWRMRRVWGEVHDENACGVGGVAGHAGLFANGMDIARFGQAWLAHDQRLSISESLMEVAVTQQFAGNDLRYGLGWRLNIDGDGYGHTGFTGTSLWISPKRQLVLALLTNRVVMGREKPGIMALRQAVQAVLQEM